MEGVVGCVLSRPTYQFVPVVVQGLSLHYQLLDVGKLLLDASLRLNGHWATRHHYTDSYAYRETDSRR